MGSLERRPIKPKRASVKRMEDRMLGGVGGDVISKAEITSITGTEMTDASCDAYAICMSARSYVLQTGPLWVYDREVGFKCLNDKEKVSYNEAKTRNLRKRARHVGDVHNTIDYNKLTPEEQQKSAAMAIQAGAIEIIASRKTTQRLTEDKPVQHLPKASEVLEAFRHRLNK